MNPLAVWKDDLARRLEALDVADLRRRPELPSGIDFCSNDYLGFTRDRELAQAIAGRIAEIVDKDPTALSLRRRVCCAGRRGCIGQLEARLARFKGTEATLLFPSGYQANLALLTAILGPEDRALSDELNHASLIDALRLSGCRRSVVPHLDLAAYERALGEPIPVAGRWWWSSRSSAWMAMRLRSSPLPSSANGTAPCWSSTKRTRSASSGGERASGLVEEQGLEQRVAASVTTFGKALATQGACIAGSRVLVEWIVNRARPFIFSTAVSPLLLVALDASLDHLAAHRERASGCARARLFFAGGCAISEIGVVENDSPIVPVVLGDNRRAMAVAEAVRSEGFDVRAVRPPTVPEGKARLSISVHSDHSEADLGHLAAAIGRAIVGVAA